MSLTILPDFAVFIQRKYFQTVTAGITIQTQLVSFMNELRF